MANPNKWTNTARRKHRRRLVRQMHEIGEPLGLVEKDNITNDIYDFNSADFVKVTAAFYKKLTGKDLPSP